MQINPLTVGKAYGELEREGTVEMRRGLGVFVPAARAVPRAGRETVPAGVAEGAQRFVLEAAQAGLDRAQALKLIENTWRELVALDRDKAVGRTR